MFVAGAQVGQLLHKVVADALLLEQVHQQIVQVAIENVSGDGIGLVRMLSSEDGDLVDSKDVICKKIKLAGVHKRDLHIWAGLTVSLLVRLFVQEGAGEGEGLSIANNVHLELGRALHLGQVGLLLFNFRLLVSVHRVVDVEFDENFLLVVLLHHLYLGAIRLHLESLHVGGNLLALRRFALSGDLFG